MLDPGHLTCAVLYYGESVKADLCMPPQRGDCGASAGLLSVIPCPQLPDSVCVALVITPYAHVQCEAYIDTDDRA